MFYSRWSVIDKRGYAQTKEEARRARLRRPARPVVVMAKLKAVLTLCSCRPFCNVAIPDNDALASHVGARLQIPCAVGG